MRRHAAFVVESAHGHIIPTLGMARSLVERGYRVSFAVKRSFSRTIEACGAEAKIYHPMEVKRDFLSEIQRSDGGFAFDLSRIDVPAFMNAFAREAQNTLFQLEAAYRSDPPDLVIYDRNNPAGKLLAHKWEIPKIEHCPSMVGPDLSSHDEKLVMVSIPMFLQENARDLDSRFHFVNRSELQEAATQSRNAGTQLGEATILASATTGLLSQAGFFLMTIRALSGLPVKVHLSIADEIREQQFGTLPDNFLIERNRPHGQILRNCRLFIGQGGPGGITEAVAHGVPMLLLPPSGAHEPYARRVHALGLGLCVSVADLSEQSLRRAVISLLDDDQTLSRVRDMQIRMFDADAAEDAVTLIESFMAQATC